jgi:hypothetical protein
VFGSDAVFESTVLNPLAWMVDPDAEPTLVQYMLGL